MRPILKTHKPQKPIRVSLRDKVEMAKEMLGEVICSLEVAAIDTKLISNSPKGEIVSQALVFMNSAYACLKKYNK